MTVIYPLAGTESRAVKLIFAVTGFADTVLSERTTFIWDEFNSLGTIVTPARVLVPT